MSSLSWDQDDPRRDEGHAMAMSMKAFNYKGWDLFEAIDALMAYDHGALDSGVNDPDMKEAVRKHLGSFPEAELVRMLDLYAIKMFESGYHLEDVVGFANWINDDLRL
jgi:hypothetical protein